MQPSEAVACSSPWVRGLDLTDGASLRERALQDAFDRNYTRLLRLCVVLTGSREAGEDLAQESFARIAPRIQELEESEWWPYLRMIAANQSKNRWRRLGLERRERFRPADHTDPSEAVDDRDQTWRAVVRLPPRQRAVVALRYYEDLKEREIAAVLGCSLGTVKSQLSRALQRLKKELRDDD